MKSIMGKQSFPIYLGYYKPPKTAAGYFSMLRFDVKMDRIALQNEE